MLDFPQCGQCAHASYPCGIRRSLPPQAPATGAADDAPTIASVYPAHAVDGPRWREIGAEGEAAKPSRSCLAVGGVNSLVRGR